MHQYFSLNFLNTCPDASNTLRAHLHWQSDAERYAIYLPSFLLRRRVSLSASRQGQYGKLFNVDVEEAESRCPSNMGINDLILNLSLEESSSMASGSDEFP
ncbi:hypothetical protein CDAR_164001 [Caerostris darwini]|uniref:Uncharacterized protein n=1 Tax=Caerostris darwini TaxID=1538125 RepID=A0AAV4UX75_9ARAC|nr:hypothetical protein CDAR_164001 [Caerostris darwini]